MFTGSRDKSLHAIDVATRKALYRLPKAHECVGGALVGGRGP